MNPFILHSRLQSTTREYTNYRLTNYSSHEPKYTIAAATGIPVKHNELLELPALYEAWLLKLEEKRISELQKQGTPFLFIIDITTYDLTDPREDNDSSVFHQDIIKQWNVWSAHAVITIVVNTKAVHTGLKVIPWTSA